MSLALFLLAGCAETALEFQGRWEGTADLTVDGETKTVTLVWELVETDAGLGGRIQWDDHTRQITACSTEGPEIRVESDASGDSISFDGLYRTDRVEGRFSIRYARDPEPYRGRFRLIRKL